MKLDHAIYNFIAVLLSIAFFGLYLFVMYNFYHLNPWQFPYIILTGYFILSLICYPFIAMDASAFALKVKAVRPLVQVTAFIIAPIILIRKLLKKD